MIDRISRNFISYADYRQSMSSHVVPRENYEKSNGLGVESVNGRSRFIAMNPYLRRSVETALIHGMNASERIGVIYNEHRYIAAQVESSGHPSGLPYKGRYVDISG